MRLTAVVPVLTVALGITVHAQTSFILRPAATANVSTVATRHALSVVRPLDSAGSVFLVTGSATIPASQVESEVGADADVTDIEVDQETALPELSQAIGIPPRTLPPPEATFYEGVSVLNSYLSQPASEIVNLWSTQADFKVTGGGTVAIIDTGIDPGNNVLAASLLPGYDFLNNTAGAANDWGDLDSKTRNLLLASNPNPASKSYDAVINQSTGVILDQSTGVILDGGNLPAAFGHGTMVAGIVHLVAPTAKLMPLRAFSANGTAHLSDILRAIYFAADSGVHVINMSFTFLQSSEELSDAINYAQEAGSICVAAAGNTGTSYVASPANLNEVMGIASTTSQDTLSPFTSYGVGVFLAAPGQHIVTTYPGNNYAQVSGTSFSTPFVTGTVALLYQYTPTTGSDGTHSYLSHAVPVSTLVGNGRLDIYQTIHAASLAASSTDQ